MNRLRALLRLSVVALLSALLLAANSFAQEASRITDQISESDRVTLPNTRPPFAQAQNDEGAVDASLPMNRILLLLKPSPRQIASLQRLLDSQQNPKSSNYRNWLTPEQYASQFGPSDADVQRITNWLEQHGFQVQQVAAGRQWIEFSGTAAQVQSAFQTEVHSYAVNGRKRYANSRDISLPRALTSVVRGVLSLNNFEKHPMSTKSRLVVRDQSGALVPDGLFQVGEDGTVGITPSVTQPGPNGTFNHFLSPGDFQKIYNVSKLVKEGTDGRGVTIAIVGRTDIQLSDVHSFRQIFGLPENDPTIITNGIDPGFTPDELEADLDVEWAGAAAPNAQIKFVTSETTASTDGVDLSAAYIVDHRVAPIMSTSFGQCEAFLGPAGNAFYKSLWQQAAAEGITAFVSSGDDGAAGCDAPSGSGAARDGQNVSGLASTPYNVAVGGTEFNENGLDANYWATTNGPDQSSAWVHSRNGLE